MNRICQCGSQIVLTFMKLCMKLPMKLPHLRTALGSAFFHLAAPDGRFRHMTVNENTHLGDEVDHMLASKRARQQAMDQRGGIMSGRKREVKITEQALTEEGHKARGSPPSSTSVLHPGVPAHQGLQPWEEERVFYPTAPSAHRDSSVDSHSAEDYLEPEREVAKWERMGAVPTGGLRLSKLRQEQISSTVLNLKVSQVLLQQCNASLDPVESYLQTWEGHGGGASRIAVTMVLPATSSFSIGAGRPTGYW